MIRRRPVTVREAVASNAKAKDSFLRSDKNMEQYIRVRFCFFTFTVKLF